MGRFGNHRHNDKFGHRHNKRPRQPPQGNVSKSPRQNANYSSLKESEIGITEYTSKTKGFTGIIKQRISDFHVNEIDFNGKICKLTDLSLPKSDEQSVDSETPVSADELIALVTQEKFDAISTIDKADKKCEDHILIDVTAMEKPERTKIHQMIKECCKTVSSTTVEIDGKKFIKCLKQSKKGDSRTRWIWPSEYTYFLLHKENIDTMQAVSSIAPLLNGARATAITYSGTKDKRGKTTQWLCIRRREPSLIKRSVQRLRNIHVGNFMFRDQPLKLGQLQGNRFRIALRQLNGNEEDITEALNNFKMNGFINYYGHQRFGNHASVPTHQIGLFLVQGNFKEACEMILKPRDNDTPDMQRVREHWWENRQAKEALALLQRHDRGGRSIESKLLAGLTKNGPNDYVNSLEQIPRNVRLMYIHAYQSLIWNEIVSQRIAAHGLNLCEGDLVYVDTTDMCADHIDDDQIEIDEIDDNEQPSNANANENENTDEASKVSRFQAMVKPLTQADIDSNKYSIFDVVLPLPGHDITYPSNECAQWYEDRLKRDNLSSELLKRKQKTYSLSGAYRKMLVKPIDLNWHFMKYNDECDTLIRSDIEELNGEKVPVSIEDGKQKALVLEFSLPSSSYATMALREILKCDTSVANQVQLQKSIAMGNNSTPDDPGSAETEGDIAMKKSKLDESCP